VFSYRGNSTKSWEGQLQKLAWLSFVVHVAAFASHQQKHTNNKTPFTELTNCNCASYLPTLKIASIHQLPGLCCCSQLLGRAPLTRARLQSATARPSSMVSAVAGLLLLLLLLLLRQLDPSDCKCRQEDVQCED
jgi:hypothetical protein